MFNIILRPTMFASVAELADALDLGSSAQQAWGFESPLSHNFYNLILEDCLDVQVNQISDSKQEVEINLEYNEIQPEIQDAYKEESKKIQVDGFRKGKAPMGIIKKLYGEAIEYKASEKIATKKFWDAVDQENLKPISTPSLIDINFEPGKTLSFKVSFDIKPILTIKDYKGLEIEKPVFKLKDEDVEKELNYLLKPYLVYQEVDTVEDSSCKLTVNLSKLDADGNVAEAPASENMQIDLSDEKVNPIIVENSKGKKVGESFNFDFVDEHYHGEELHKEEFHYSVLINKIEKAVESNISEDIIKKVSANKSTTMDELREQLRTNLVDYQTRQSDEIYINTLLNDIVKNNEFTPPSGFVETVHKRLIDVEIENAKRYKVKNPDEKAISDYLKPRAEWNAKWQIIMENIAGLENITISDAELEEEAKKESEKTGISVPKLIKFYKDSNRTEVLLEEKVIQFLKENNTAKEVDAEEKLKEKKGKS